MGQSSADECVASTKAPGHVSVRGFEYLDSGMHMFSWLRRGPDAGRFIVNDVEGELYAQDSGAQLECVRCTDKPRYETKVRAVAADGKGVVSEFTVAVPLLIGVMDSSGKKWDLSVRLSYHATGLDTPDQFKLSLGFSILDQKATSDTSLQSSPAR